MRTSMANVLDFNTTKKRARQMLRGSDLKKTIRAMAIHDCLDFEASISADI